MISNDKGKYRIMPRTLDILLPRSCVLPAIGVGSTTLCKHEWNNLGRLRSFALFLGCDVEENNHTDSVNKEATKVPAPGNDPKRTQNVHSVYSKSFKFKLHGSFVGVWPKPQVHGIACGNTSVDPASRTVKCCMYTARQPYLCSI